GRRPGQVAGGPAPSCRAAALAGHAPGRDRLGDGPERRFRGGPGSPRPAGPATRYEGAARRVGRTTMSGDESTPDPDRMAGIDRALAEYLLAADAGSAPEPAAWLARYPDLQPELGELLVAEVGLQRLADPLRPAPGQAIATNAPTTVAG